MKTSKKIVGILSIIFTISILSCVSFTSARMPKPWKKYHGTLDTFYYDLTEDPPPVYIHGEEGKIAESRWTCKLYKREGTVIANLTIHFIEISMGVEPLYEAYNHFKVIMETDNVEYVTEDPGTDHIFYRLEGTSNWFMNKEPLYNIWTEIRLLPSLGHAQFQMNLEEAPTPVLRELHPEGIGIFGTMLLPAPPVTPIH